MNSKKQIDSSNVAFLVMYQPEISDLVQCRLIGPIPGYKGYEFWIAELSEPLRLKPERYPYLTVLLRSAWQDHDPCPEPTGVAVFEILNDKAISNKSISRPSDIAILGSAILAKTAKAADSLLHDWFPTAEEFLQKIFPSGWKP